MNRAAGTKQPKKQKAAPIKEYFRLKYLRFKCRDITRTLDFYKSLGMTVDFEGEQESFRPTIPGANQANQKVPAVKTMESSHVKKNPNLAADSDADNIPQGGPCGRIFGVSFVPQVTGPAAKELLAQRVQLVFEEDLDYQQEIQINQLKEKAKIEDGKSQKTEKSSPTDKSNRQYDYLVIYVHFLSRILKRMESKGFDTVLDITSFENVKIAILKDPNNIQIRLTELPDSYLNDAGAKQWFARLAYYTLPSSNADETVVAYESYFQTRLQKQLLKSEKEKEKPNNSAFDDQNTQVTNLRKLGPAQTVKQALAKGSGFRLVDMDEFVVGLTNSVFYWLGNEMRTNGCCLCVTEVSNADTGVAYTSYDREKSALKALGFEVASVDSVVSRLKYETNDDLEWDQFRYRMAKQGIAARFIDKINGIALELFTTKMDTQPTQKGVAHRPNRLPAIPNKALGAKDETKEGNEFVINMNHLKGHARTLSDGAIECTKGYGYDSLFKETQQSLPPIEEPVKVFPRKGGKFINSGASALQSELSLALNAKRRPDSGHRRIKDRDEMLIELLITREKSKSV